MTGQRSPDERLVYRQCSPIFSGPNAGLRKKKSIHKLLVKHESSITALVEEYTLPAIALVVKKLLEDGIFKFPSRARLRYPELFLPTNNQAADRTVSQEEVPSVETNASGGVILTSADEGERACRGLVQDSEQIKPGGPSKDSTESSGCIQTTVFAAGNPAAPQESKVHTTPELRVVYLPFKTKHNILISVQRMLEECCFEFGNAWIPLLMEAEQWHEVEAVEITQWTQRALRNMRSLPPAATNSTIGKGIAEVFHGVNSLRNSAVHRDQTSAEDIVKMLGAAINFAEALNDPRRARKIAEILAQVEICIKEISQHQKTLERELTGRLDEIARRRAELDELEKRSIEVMLSVDKMQRIEVAKSIESGLVGPYQTPGPCAHDITTSFKRAKKHSEPELGTGNSKTHHNLRSSKGAHKRSIHDMESYDEEGPEDLCIEPREQDPLELTPPAGISVSEEDKKEGGNFNGKADFENCQIHSSHKGRVGLRECASNKGEKSTQCLEDILMSKYGSGERFSQVYPAETIGSLLQPPTLAFSGPQCDEGSPLPHSLAATSRVPSILAGAGSKLSDPLGPAIILKILNDGKVLGPIYSTRDCTRNAILSEARGYCTQRVQYDENLKIRLAKPWDLVFSSLNVHGYNIDLSACDVDNLSFLIQSAGKTQIPIFTLRIVEG